MSAFRGPSHTKHPTPARATYRHLLHPSALTPSNPLRVIAHCDIDAAYAQFEAVRIGSPDHVPLIVVQWETIIAVNYPARKYGITRCARMGPKEARELCPHLVVVHTATYRPGESESGYWEDANVLTHKVSLDPYRHESAKIINIFREMVPKGQVEKASIDEAYMDLTSMVVERLTTIHPYLACVPADAPDGVDSPLPPPPPIDWCRAGNMIPTDAEDRARLEGSEEHGDIEGHELDVPRDRPSWGDWALCIGAEIMAEVRGEIWRRLHYTCSAGIAHNKAMAKLCSSYKKPNNQTVLQHSAVPFFLRDTPFTNIRNLGGKLGRAIADEYGVETVGGLLSVELRDMQNRFGEESIWVYNIIRGIDHTEINPRQYNKTMLASKNLIPPVTEPDQAIHWIDLLAGELTVRLNEAREKAEGLWPKTLVLSWRIGYGYGNNLRSKQCSFPYTPSLSAAYIAGLGRRMWKEVVPVLLRSCGGSMDVHNLALQFSGVERTEEGQRNIENFLDTTGRQKADRPDLAATGSRRLKRSRSASSVTEETTSLDGPTRWTCPRCHQRLHFTSDTDENEVKHEHEDWHYAMNLQQELELQNPGTRRKGKVKKHGKGDIRAFLRPR